MEELKKIRQKIDQVDEEIAKLLRKRMTLIEEIRDYKRENSIPTTNKNREEEIMKKLDTEFEKNIFKKIIQESKKAQKRF